MIKEDNILKKHSCILKQIKAELELTPDDPVSSSTVNRISGRVIELIDEVYLITSDLQRIKQ